MPQYLVAIYHPEDYDPSKEGPAVMEDIHALNREMIAAGARKLACGLAPVRNARTLRKQPDGKVSLVDGPYTETKEHIGGFWILESPRSGGGHRVGAQGCRRLPCIGRGASDAFPPGSEPRSRRKQVSNLATAPSEHAP